jgi:hypothetical protein
MLFCLGTHGVSGMLVEHGHEGILSEALRWCSYYFVFLTVVANIPAVLGSLQGIFGAEDEEIRELARLGAVATISVTAIIILLFLLHPPLTQMLAAILSAVLALILAIMTERYRHV